ncbi:hypothetical protein D3C84_1044770 [compost metagenome]
MAVQVKLVALSQLPYLEHLLLDLSRENVNSPNDQHVVTASRDLVDTAHGASSAWQQPSQIAGTVADHW